MCKADLRGLLNSKGGDRDEKERERDNRVNARERKRHIYRSEKEETRRSERDDGVGPREREGKDKRMQGGTERGIIEHTKRRRRRRRGGWITDGRTTGLGLPLSLSR